MSYFPMEGYFYLRENNDFPELKDEVATWPLWGSHATELIDKRGITAMAWTIDLDYQAEIESLVHIKGRKEYL